MWKNWSQKPRPAGGCLSAVGRKKLAAKCNKNWQQVVFWHTPEGFKNLEWLGYQMRQKEMSLL
jgi:hypothetical protein